MQCNVVHYAAVQDISSLCSSLRCSTVFRDLRLYFDWLLLQVTLLSAPPQNLLLSECLGKLNIHNKSLQNREESPVPFPSPDPVPASVPCSSHGPAFSFVPAPAPVPALTHPHSSARVSYSCIYKQPDYNQNETFTEYLLILTFVGRRCGTNT